MMGDLRVVGLGQAIEIGPQKRQPFGGCKLNGFKDVLRFLAGQSCAERIKSLFF